MIVNVSPETDGTESVIVPVNPWLVNVTVEVVVPPAVNETGDGVDAMIEKSPPTVKVTKTEWTDCPAVPVTLNV